METQSNNLIWNWAIRSIKFTKFVITVLAFTVVLTAFVLVSLPVLIYGVSGFIVLVFASVVLFGLFWLLLFLLRQLLPEFNVTITTLLERNKTHEEGTTNFPFKE